MNHFQLARVILALVVLELACATHVAEASSHGSRHNLHSRQSWNWLSGLMKMFSNPTGFATPPSTAPSPPPPPPVPSPPPLPPVQSLPKLSSTSLAPAPTSAPPAPPPQSSLAPVPTPTSSPVTSASTPLAVPTPSPSPMPTLSSAPTPTTTIAPVPTQNPSGCTNPRVRPEWRTLSRDQQVSYITAVKCLAKLPSKLLPGGDYRRYDDFQNVHSRMRTNIHWIANFLPWHRHFMFLYEQALRNECGYTGNLPRWDWTLDSNDMTKSPIWSSDPEVGFGTNGLNFTDVNPALDGGVVSDGAFAYWDLYYPEYHQLQRNYNLPSQYRIAGRSWGSQFFDQASISRIHSQTTYARFAVALEGTDPISSGPSNPGPHSIIHTIIGGEISPTTYAANEPFVHLLIRFEGNCR